MWALMWFFRVYVYVLIFWLCCWTATGGAPAKEKEEEIVKKYTLEKEHELR